MNYSTEFRSHEDDAWYTVMVTLEEKETLRINYEKFTDEVDQLFTPSFFDSLEDLREFEKRFRPLSIQVQDHECRKLVPGVKVCASLHCIPGDLRFYDAIVELVQESPHSRKKNEECHCTFILTWLHGPNDGNMTAAEIGDICTVQPIVEIDPVLASFLEIAKRRIESKSGQEVVSNCNGGIETKNRLSLFERMQKGRRRAKRSVLGDCSPKVLDQKIWTSQKLWTMISRRRFSDVLDDEFQMQIFRCSRRSSSRCRFSYVLDDVFQMFRFRSSKRRFPDVLVQKSSTMLLLHI